MGHDFTEDEQMAIGIGRRQFILGLGSSAFAQSAQSAARISPETIHAFAPTGRLRAAINAGNVVLVQKGADGTVKGVTVDLTAELARRLGLPADLIVYETAGNVTDAAKADAWDICFLAIEPARAALIDFTAPYVIIEGTYLVDVHSPLKSVADVDHAGIRIAVARGSAYDLYLSRTLQHATLVRYPSPPLALQGFSNDGLDAAAGVRQFLDGYARSNPNLTVMSDHFQEIREAMGIARGRGDAANYLHRFVEEMKASGYIRASLERAHQSALIAPPKK
jgi:polar amino acid transport system substrate-binding protein